MAIRMLLRKEDNILYTDFMAYWAIENIVFSNQNGQSITDFTFKAYPNRESKHHTGMPINKTLDWGSPVGLAYQGCLYESYCAFPTLDIFPNGIPVSEVEQKSVLYQYLKEYLNLKDCEDVLEE